MHACSHWLYPTFDQIFTHIDTNHWNRTCESSFNSEVGLAEDVRLHSLPSAASTTTATSFFINNPTERECHEMIPMWWSAAGTILATFLIEYDRFLAIRYPLLYPEMISDERSVFACVAAQIGCLCLVLSVRHISPDSFVCEEMVGDVVLQVNN